MPGTVDITSPRNSTHVAPDGAVRSMQSARLQLPYADLSRLWSAAALENLGRTYWLFLSKVTLGLIRVRYAQDTRSVVLLGRWLTLLRFNAPEYTFDPERGRISWAIRDGLLVSRAGRGSGYLSLSVRRYLEPRDPATLWIDVEVANFYPAIASRMGTLAYKLTQSCVHVLVTHAFLRSLATLDLAESRVRRFPS